MAVNLDFPSLTDLGYIASSEAVVLAGVIADLQSAFGGRMSFTTSSGAPINATPQAQEASTLAATVANAEYEFLSLANGVDPAFSSGRLQDALGRIFFIERVPDSSTVVQCNCVGKVDTVIPPGAEALDTSGNRYVCFSGGTIPNGGVLPLEFQNLVTGPIPCLAGTLTEIFQAVPGWDTISNPLDGALGRVVETRAEMEARRQEILDANELAFPQTMLEAVLAVESVLDAYITENVESMSALATPQAVFVGTTVGTALTVESVTSGALAIGQYVVGEGIDPGITLVSGLDTDWVLSDAPDPVLDSVTITSGRVLLLPNSVFAGVRGGVAADVARAVWSKKSPGAAYSGNTTVTVYDDSAQYTPPGIPYDVTFQMASPITIFMSVTIKTGPQVPSDAADQIRTAVVDFFNTTDDLIRLRMGHTVFAARFYPIIMALGTWVTILDLRLGSINTPDVVFTAELTGTEIEITAILNDTDLTIGAIIAGEDVELNTILGSQVDGSSLRDGTYNVTPTQILASETMYTLTVDDYTVELAADQYPTCAPGAISVVFT